MGCVIDTILNLVFGRICLVRASIPGWRKHEAAFWFPMPIVEDIDYFEIVHDDNDSDGIQTWRADSPSFEIIDDDYSSASHKVVDHQEQDEDDVPQSTRISSANAPITQSDSGRHGSGEHCEGGSPQNSQAFCDYCGSFGHLRRCGKCHVAVYCSSK